MSPTVKFRGSASGRGSGWAQEGAVNHTTRPIVSGIREPAQHDYNGPHVWFSSGQKSNEGDRSRGAVVQPICISLLALRNAFCTLCSLSDWPYEPGFPTP